MEPTDVVVGARGAKITKRWNPKDWRPIYEAMVALCVLGEKTQGQIAKEFGYTEAWLSQIMNSPKGKEVQAQIIRNTRDRSIGNVTDRLRDIQELALKRMEDVIRDDKIATKSPLAIFDRSALFLKNTGVIKDSQASPAPVSQAGTVINQTNNTLIVSGKDADNLRDGLNKANEVKSLHSGVIGSIDSTQKKVETVVNEKVVNG